MNKAHFSWIALGIGIVIAMLLMRFGAPGADGKPGLPLLTTLFLAEFGFVVSAGGAYFGFRQLPGRARSLAALLPPIACLLLALGFAWLGLGIWSERVAV